MISSGKPKEIAEKTVEGRIRKVKTLFCWQTFVIDGKVKLKMY